MPPPRAERINTMATIPAKHITHLFNRPGYWKYVIDDEDTHQEQFNNKAQKPDFIPEGHWEWMPSPNEIMRELAKQFQAHWMSLSAEERERISKENEAFLTGKGITIHPDSWIPHKSD